MARCISTSLTRVARQAKSSAASPGLRRMVPRVVNGAIFIGLTVFAAVYTAQLFWALWPVEAMQSSQPAERALNQSLLTANQRGQDAVSLDRILAYQWFQNDDSPMATENAAIETSAVETQLPLSLRGAIPSSDRDAGMAIIAVGDRQSVVTVGSPVDLAPRGVRLDAVMPDHVILDNNGRRETLWLFGPPDPTGQSEAGNTGSRPADPVSPGPRVEEEITGFDYRDLGTPGIHRVDGRFAGIRIGEEADGERLARHGLRRGDVVTAIDGRPLQDMGQAMEAVRSLQSASRVSLEVLRDGDSVSMTLNLQP